MKNFTTINCPVTITAIGFDGGLHAYPKRMEWDGQTYLFIDRGIRVRRGESMCGSVTMTNGKQNFCLKRTAGSWMLVSMSEYV